MTEESIRVTAGRPTARGGSGDTPAARRRSPVPRVPSELVVLAALGLALLIAAAVADNFEIAWGFVTLLGAAYILSRGLARRGGRDDLL